MNIFALLGYNILERVSVLDIFKVLISSLLSVAAIFVITRLMGHKQVAQLDFFDYVNGITVGSIAAEMATELEEPWKPFLAMLVYCAVSVILSKLANRFPRSRKLINGTPTVLLDEGKIYRDNMKKAKLDLSEFLAMCRQEGYFDINEIQTAVFEYDGRLTVMPKSDNRPVTPSDIGLSVAKASFCTEVIMDGRIMGEDLKRIGLNEAWLLKNIKEQGYFDASEILLGIVGAENKLSLYAK